MNTPAPKPAFPHAAGSTPAPTVTVTVGEPAAPSAKFEFKILSGIPMPERRGFGQAKYDWAALEVGQSFFIPGRKVKEFSSGLSLAKKRLQKTIPGITFSARDYRLNGVDGVMVWRTA